MSGISVENFHEICRLCLVKHGNMFNIFHEPLPKRITSIADFEVNEGDGLPTMICQNCSLEIDRSYEFKVMCQNSDTTLRNCLRRQTSDSDFDGEEDHEGAEEDDDTFEVPEDCSPKFEVIEFIMEDPEEKSLEQTEKLETTGIQVLKQPEIFEEIKLDVEDVLLSQQRSTKQLTNSHRLEDKGILDNTDIEKRVSTANNTPKNESKRRLHNKSIVRFKKTQAAIATKSRSGDDGPPFLCTICSKFFPKRDNLRKHQIVHRGEKPYLCEECGKSFNRKQDLNIHRRYHSGVRPYECVLCEKMFHSYSGLKSHENRHNGVKPFLCNRCGKTFGQKSQLTNHERVHTHEKPYICSTCEKTFTTLTNLRTHQKRHAGINEFICGSCGKTFFTKSGLERHQLVHSGHKAFSCDLCDLSFFTKSEMTRHMRYHKGEKRFTCKRCNKSFIENQHLVIHQRIHTGERPYDCQVCNKSFYTKSKLNRHMRTHPDVKDLTSEPEVQASAMKDLCFDRELPVEQKYCDISVGKDPCFDPGLQEEPKERESSFSYMGCHWAEAHLT